MTFGTVKYFSEAKRFGFIECENLPDSFFHLSDCQFDVNPRIGDRVSFEVTAADRGPRARDVRLAD